VALLVLVAPVPAAVLVVPELVAPPVEDVEAAPPEPEAPPEPVALVEPELPLEPTACEATQAPDVQARPALHVALG